MFFEKEFDIYYRDTEDGGKIKLDCLLLYLQEAAILHSIQVGFDEAYMQKNSCAWVMNRLGLQMEKMPQIRTRLKIKTWTTGIKSFKAIREFEIYENNSFVGVASTHWFFIDINQRKLKRIPEEVKNFYGEVPKNVELNLDDVEFEDPDFDIIFSKTHSLRHYDIDTNGHLNNTVYAQLLEDTLVNVISNFTVKGLKILYKKEVPYHFNKVTCSIGNGNTTNTFNFKFFNETTLFSYGNITVI